VTENAEPEPPCPLCGEPMQEEVRGRDVARDPERQDDIEFLDDDQVSFVEDAYSAYHFGCGPWAIHELVAAEAVGQRDWWLRMAEQAGYFHSEAQRTAVVRAAELVRAGQPMPVLTIPNDVPEPAAFKVAKNLSPIGDKPTTEGQVSHLAQLPAPVPEKNVANHATRAPSRASSRAVVDDKLYVLRQIKGHWYLYLRRPGKSDKSLGPVDAQLAAKGADIIPDLVRARAMV
jgi:hypothetical protein